MNKLKIPYRVQIGSKIILPPCPICDGETEPNLINRDKWNVKEGYAFDCQNEKCEGYVE